MKKTFEAFLREHPLHEVPDTLDHKVLALLEAEAGPAGPQGLGRRRIPLWISVMACLLVGVASAWLGRLSAPAPDESVVVDEAVERAGPETPPAPEPAPRQAVPGPNVGPGEMLAQVPKREPHPSNTYRFGSNPEALNRYLWEQAKERNIQSSRERFSGDPINLRRREALRRLQPARVKLGSPNREETKEVDSL